MNKVKSAAEELIDTLVNGTKRSAVELAIKNLRHALDTDLISTVGSTGPSPTAGMNIEERILHVGGRNNAAGYVEFGSVQAVKALINQVLRDLPGLLLPKRQEPVAWRYELATRVINGEYTDWHQHISQYRPDVKTEAIRFLSPLYSQPMLPNQAASKEEVYSALTAVDSHDALTVWRRAEKFHRIGADNEAT